MEKQEIKLRTELSIAIDTKDWKKVHQIQEKISKINKNSSPNAETVYIDAFSKQLGYVASESNVSWTKIAKQAGISRSAIFKIRQGKFKQTSFETVAKIAKALNISLDKILEEV